MPRAVITGRAVPGGTGVTVLARVRGAAGALVTRASLSSITYTVSDLTDGTTLGTGTATISSSVFDSLQQGDVRWAADSADTPGPDGAHGYNFAFTLPASLFAARTLAAADPLAGAERGHRHQADFVFTPASGQPFRLVARWDEEVVYA